MKGHKADGGGLPYKMEMQKKGVSLPNDPFRPVPSNPNPITKPKAGLGGKDCSHPFENGKPKI